jgi:hypothetical protein
VYHDCVVAQWYWGDTSNKLPALWDRRDLWNALYGTPPMFMFDRKGWQANRDRFVRSYRTATPVARATGYAEMLSHAAAARQIRKARLHYEKESMSGLAISPEACGKVGDTIGRSTRVWAHIEEAIAELPHCDSENRIALENLYDMPWPMIDEKFVPEVSRILKNVVATYELEGK